MMDAIGNTGDISFENEWVDGVPAKKNNPRSLPGSYVIIPKSHVNSPFDCSAEEWAATKAMLDVIKSYLDEKYRPDGYNLGWNIGGAAGQSSPYAHLHVVPRFADEPFAGKGIMYWLKQDGNIRGSLSSAAGGLL